MSPIPLPVRRSDHQPAHSPWIIQSHTVSRFARIVVMLLAAVVVATAVVTPAAAQRKRPEVPKENVKVAGTIKGVRGPLLHVVTEKGDQYLVKVEAKREDLAYSGTAVADFVRAGMLVSFSARFNKKGKPEAAIDKLTVFSPRESTKIGIFAAAGLGGRELFSDVEEKPNKTTDQYRAFKVAGRVTAARRGKLTVAAGRGSVKVDLAKDAEVTLDLTDLRLARPGDKVLLDGWYNPNRKTHIYARKVEITGVGTLGEKKKPVAPVAEGDKQKEAKGDKPDGDKPDSDKPEG